jgi:hypothetical protein
MVGAVEWNGAEVGDLERKKEQACLLSVETGVGIPWLGSGVGGWVFVAKDASTLVMKLVILYYLSLRNQGA